VWPLFTHVCGARRYFINATPLTITDTPRFPHRGLLVDTSRHFLPLPTLHSIIDSLTVAKLNTLHWHLVDSQSFPFDSPSYPLLGKAGSYSPQERYTPSDVTSIVSYAAARGVRVMVEIDTPGHAASWCAGYPDVCPDVANGCLEPLNPSANATFELLEGLFGDVAGLFPETLMHLGGDEVNTDCWDDTAVIAEWMAENDMDSSSTYAWFIAKVQKIAQGLGKEVIGWEVSRG